MMDICQHGGLTMTELFRVARERQISNSMNDTCFRVAASVLRSTLSFDVIELADCMKPEKNCINAHLIFANSFPIGSALMVIMQMTRCCEFLN